LGELQELTPRARIEARIAKYAQMGEYERVPTEATVENDNP
jgi:hypothetical protein